MAVGSDYGYRLELVLFKDFSELMRDIGHARIDNNALRTWL
jgi:hypothetical protein